VQIKTKPLSFVVILIISVFLIQTSEIVQAGQTYLKVINPLTGDKWFNFTTNTKKVGDTFVINITVVEVTDLQCWQINFTWNASLLGFVSIKRPTDHVFAGSGKSMIAPAPKVEPGYVLWGCTYINADPYWTFNGTGRLCQITLNITQPVEGLPETEVSCNLGFARLNDITYLLDGAGNQISFMSVEGFYDYKWITPTVYPTIYIKPAVCTPVAKGDIVPIEIWVKNVDVGWSIIGFQFSLMWNTTFMTPTLGPNGTYFNNGTFLEAFQYYPNGVSYFADINIHNRPPPLTPIPDDYNYSKFTIKLLPDNPPNPQYHTPFPSGSGKLTTVYFQAVYETIFPVEDWTRIELIQFKVNEDTYAFNQYSLVIKVYSEQCNYRAPVKVLTPGVHDVAVMDIMPSKTVVGQGYNMSINVTVENQGNFTETFNVSLYANTTAIANLNNITLTIGNSTTVTFAWNNTGFARGNYTIKAVADTVQNETETADNTLIDDTVLVGVPCDVTSATPGVPDGICDMRDIGYMCKKFGATPGDPKWDPNCDVSGQTRGMPDGIVDMRDIGEACRNFMRT